MFRLLLLHRAADPLRSKAAFSALPRLDVGEWQGKMLQNGVPLSLKKLGRPAPGQYAVWCGGAFLGLGTVGENAEGMRLKRF